MSYSVFSSGKQVKSVLLRSLTVGAISTITLLSGFAPTLSSSLPHLWEAAVSAQTDESALTRYVRAAFEIEKTRRAMAGRVKEMTEGNTPSNVCQPGSIAQLQAGIRDQVKAICDDFRAQADAIVKKYKLSHEEFNGFQKSYKQNPDPINSEIKRLGLQ